MKPRSKGFSLRKNKIRWETNSRSASPAAGWAPRGEGGHVNASLSVRDSLCGKRSIFAYEQYITSIALAPRYAQSLLGVLRAYSRPGPFRP